VQSVTAFELRDPMLLLVLMKPNYPLLRHRATPTSKLCMNIAYPHPASCGPALAAIRMVAGCVAS
jgi:hypothetical protein